MLNLSRCIPLILACAVGPALAGDGLKIGAATAMSFGPQTNIRLNASVLNLSPADPWRLPALHQGSMQPAGAALLGDYYFSSADTVVGQPRTGFRASSGLIVHQSNVAVGDVAFSGRSAATFGLATPVHGTAFIGTATAADYSFSAVPYLGLGYSGVVEKTGWGYWADVGVVAQRPGGALRFGRDNSGAQGIDDVMRELRLSPMLQLGVNYAF